jgi:hypothetical protein
MRDGVGGLLLDKTTRPSTPAVVDRIVELTAGRRSEG